MVTQHTAVLLGNSSTLNKRGENPPRCNQTTPADSSVANLVVAAQSIFSFSAVMGFHEALKTEYTALQAQTLRESELRCAAMTMASGGDLGQVIRAINASSSDPVYGTSGRDDSAGDTQPQLRPPTDLRGNAASFVSLTSDGAAALGQSRQRRPVMSPDDWGRGK